MQLAIDTSTDTASLALARDGQIIAELTWHCGQSHTTELLPHLAELLHQSRVPLESVSGIIVARGPGSFNGLRIGIGTAKGLALSLGCPIVGISSLEVAASPYAGTGLPICPVFNAGRGEIAAAVYQQNKEVWRQLVAEHITNIDTLCSKITTRTIFCGDFVHVIAQSLREQLKGKAMIMSSPAARLRRAGFLAELGLKRLEAGNLDNPATLQPLYLRGPSITKPKRQQINTDTRQSPQTSPGNTSDPGPDTKMAVIWDMDGVIADTATFHLKAWQKVFRARGVEITEQDFKRNFGQRNDTIIRNILGQDTPQNEIDAIVADKESIFRSSAAGKIQALPGAIELIKLLAGQRVKLALVSSAPVENIQLVIASLGINNCFQTIISESDVTEGKPSPQGFLLAAGRLKVKPEKCVVIEDAIAGVAAAKRAGMRCLAVTNTHPGTKLKQADIVVDTLEAVSRNDMERLVQPGVD